MTVDTRPKRFSLCMDIDGFVRNNRFPRDYRNLFRDDNGRTLSPEEARAQFAIEKAKGRKVIPMSAECSNPCKHAAAGCTGFDYAGRGCPGRYIGEGAAC